MKRTFYNFKIILKNKELIFWTFAFPIILCTLFFMAFSEIKTAQKYEAIKVSVVENGNNSLLPIYMGVFDEIGEENTEGRLIEPRYEGSLDRAKEELDNSDVIGVVIFDDGAEFPRLIVKESGISQTILQNIMTEIEQAIRAGKTFDDVNIKNVYSDGQEDMMIEYFSLLAMTCFYGAMIATKALDKNLANMTASGKRIAVASISKFKIIVNSIFTSYVIQLLGLLIVFLYMTIVLKIDFGENLAGVIGFTMVGGLAGLTLGIFISVVFKTKEDNKDGITTGYTMINCFFAGMMGPQMKYIIDANVPILNKINPVAMVTDGYYALTNFGAGERFWSDVASLLIFSVVLTVISVIVLRRQKYDKL